LCSVFDFAQLALEPRHQVFIGLQPCLLFAQAGLSLGGSFLCSLTVTANQIRLVLRGAPVDYFPLQRCLVCGRLAARWLPRSGQQSWSRNSSLARRVAFNSSDRVRSGLQRRSGRYRFDQCRHPQQQDRMPGVAHAVSVPLRRK
jgi:hypothetical protein